MATTDSIDDVLALLSSETAEALRGERLPLLFQAATACDEEHAPQVALLVERAFAGEAGQHGQRECAPWQCPSSAAAPPQGASGSSGWLSAPRKRPAHWEPSHCLGSSS